MINIVPDPPFSFPPGTVHKTAESAFGSCDAGHGPLFAVRGGINAEDALVHTSLMLQCACASADAACNQSSTLEKGLLWSILHSVEVAKALVDALLDGAETSGMKSTE
ncbi:DUF3077 domain-containing protein [Pseudomonas akapageensis]|uniref:DUF3077 domain-containing protein n=1 Tax=Pseudomonas akapageensis TaxID=2609961 RepID=UPI00140D9663|nr:DUF3077 domain-containing protein [Pseudomonas akapageensis]